MPEVDTYGTVQPHTLIRQHLDYQHWYDRAKLTLKEIHNVQYVACMNPTAGSFTINPRLQRHFSVFAVSFPGVEALKTIYQSIVSQHVSQGGFVAQVQKSVDKIVTAALNLHQKVATTFLPTAIKFHYIFNLRDLSNIFQVRGRCTWVFVCTCFFFLVLFFYFASVDTNKEHVLYSNCNTPPVVPSIRHLVCMSMPPGYPVLHTRVCEGTDGLCAAMAT